MIEKSTLLFDPIDLDSLIAAYLRFKEWMDYDVEHAAYSAKEIAVLQKLFGTSYVTVPVSLRDAGHDELLKVMSDRLDLISSYVGAIAEFGEKDELSKEDEDGIEWLLHEIDKTSYRTTVHYFRTLHEAIQDAINEVIEEGDIHEGSDLYEDQFREMDGNEIEEIRSFIISEHPELEFMDIPLENAYALGLPKEAPGPIDHNIPKSD